MGETARVVARGSTLDPRADWEALRQGLLGFVRRRVGSAEDAEDLVHDVLLRAHRELAGLPSDRLLPWLYAVARHAIIDHYRRRGAAGRKAETLRALGPAGEGSPELALHQALPDALPDALRGELAACLLGLLDALPDEQAEALRLTDLGGLSQAEAGRRLGLSPSGMKSRVQRGRAALRARIEACCEVEQDARGAPIGLESRADRCLCQANAG